MNPVAKTGHHKAQPLHQRIIAHNMLARALYGRPRTALAASLLAACAWPWPSLAPRQRQGGSALLGDGAELSLSQERRWATAIITSLYRDPDYLDHAPLHAYVMQIWQPLVQAALQRGDLSEELDQRFAWQVLLGRDRSINAFALPGGYLGVPHRA